MSQQRKKEESERLSEKGDTIKNTLAKKVVFTLLRILSRSSRVPNSIFHVPLKYQRELWLASNDLESLPI